MNPNSGEREDAQDVWESVELCFDCNKDRLHQFILWRDEPVVTSECTFCQAIRERADLGA